MNTHGGYSKKTLTDISVLLAGGGDKPFTDFIGSIQYNSTSKTLQYRYPYSDSQNPPSWLNIVTLDWLVNKNGDSRFTLYKQGVWTRILQFTITSGRYDPTISFRWHPTECDRNIWADFNVNIRLDLPALNNINNEIKFYVVYHGTAVKTLRCVKENDTTFSVWVEGIKNSWSPYGLLQIVSTYSINSYTTEVIYSDDISEYSYVEPTLGGIVNYATNTDHISTILTNSSSNHYLTFVDSNNSSASYEALYTNAGIIFNPNKRSLAQGVTVTASGYCSHAEGELTTASGDRSHAEGNQSIASKYCSHAEGDKTTASNSCAHAEGSETTASGGCAHAEGYKTTASGDYAHAEGELTQAKGSRSHTSGYDTIANNYCESAFGKYNTSNSDTLFSVGIGTANNNRINGFEVTVDGKVKAHDGFYKNNSNNTYLLLGGGGHIEISTLTTSLTQRTLTIGGNNYNVNSPYTSNINLDSVYVKKTGDTMVGTISASNDAYGGGGFNNGYANIILRGNATTGTSGIVFSSSKGDTSINRPSDCAFIQYHPYGVSAATAVGTNPTIVTSGETGRFVIGIHNDSGDQLWLQTSAANDLKHVVGANVYTIYDSGNLPAYPTVNNAALTLQINGTTQTTFYANDNTARTFNVTCDNIGAATSDHTHDHITSLGNKNASDLSSTYPSGLSVAGIYSNGYPFSYGSTITASGNNGYFQIAGQWNSAVSSLTDNDYPTEMYIRGRRDSYDVWQTWTRVLTDKNWSSVITLPTVNNGTLALLANSTDVVTFTANQSGNSVFNITSGSTNGTISVGGTDVSVQGLGALAYLNNIIVNHNSNSNAIYPLVWSNENNNSSVRSDLLYKTYESSGENSGHISWNPFKKSFAHGKGILAYGTCATAEGINTLANDYSHAEGSSTYATGDTSHAEGYNTLAQGLFSHAEGQGTTAAGINSHAEGVNTEAGPYAHAEGSSTHATGDTSHAEGYNNTASAQFSHAEGSGNTVSGWCSHVGGNGNTVTGDQSFAHGNNLTASGWGSFAINSNTTASGNYSFACGQDTTASHNYEFAAGRFNVSSSDTRFSVGGGDSSSNKLNLFEVKSGGNVYVKNILYTTDVSLTSGSISSGITKFYVSDNNFIKYITLDNLKTLFFGSTGAVGSTTQPIYWTGSQFAVSSSAEGGINIENYTSTFYPCGWTSLTTTTSVGTSSLKLKAYNGFYVNSSGAYHNSDVRLKYNINNVTNYDVVKLFETDNAFVRHYKWRSNNKDSYGFIAQEVMHYCPEAVDFNKDTGYYTVNYDVILSKLVGVMFKKIKELEKEIETLKNS